jgi:hypothetical protein
MVPETYQLVEQRRRLNLCPQPVPDMRKPPWALAVAESAPTGVDRQGRGRS